MAASRADISNWFDRGKQDPNVRYMVIVVDGWDHEDYPVYCSTKQAAIDRIRNPRQYAECNGMLRPAR